MAHFAELNNDNVVIRVIVVRNEDILDKGAESEAVGTSYCEKLFGGKWIQTSYTGGIRKRYAGVGFTYSPENDVFISPQPYQSWNLNSEFDWKAPVDMPDDDKRYKWNEDTIAWVKIPGKTRRSNRT